MMYNYSVGELKRMLESMDDNAEVNFYLWEYYGNGLKKGEDKELQIVEFEEELVTGDYGEERKVLNIFMEK